jgi:hypothetical protein
MELLAITFSAFYASNVVTGVQKFPSPLSVAPHKTRFVGPRGAESPVFLIYQTP